MLYVSYDMTSNKRRAQFSKFLKKFGRRLQGSVYELKNSRRILRVVLEEIKGSHQKHFTKEESVVIIDLCEACKKKMHRFGHSANEEEEILFL